MRPVSISDTNLLNALADVVTRYGVEGASLTRLAEASGLKRASLYHRFPGGKDEIVEAVAALSNERLLAALEPAYAEGEVEDRARRLAEGIDRYYVSGSRSCLIIALSVASDTDRASAGQCVTGWSEAFEHLALDAGFSADDARDAAIDAVAAIEGALVISATTGDTGSFERAVASLPKRLTAPGSS